MEITAKSRSVRISPLKVRITAASVKKLPVSQAINKLSLTPSKDAVEILKVLKSAVANAQSKAKLTADQTKIQNILIDEGMKMKRRDKSHGARYGSGVIQKRSSHITVILEGGANG